MASAVTVVDYGAGNLRSVANALRRVGAEVSVTADADVVARSARIVLPGVGAFGACIAALRAVPGMVDALDTRVRRDGVPFLGVCVGMQLMADTGHEHGAHRGLGWIAGSVERLPTAPGLKVPHMGWNAVAPGHAGLVEPGEAYFVHSYAVHAAPADTLATTTHGAPFAAAVGRDNMLGVQFHPEKSQAYGLALLTRFLAWRP